MGKTIGDRLVLIADKKFGGNQAEMARAMQMSPQGLNPYFTGDRDPGFKICKRLVELGINLTWVFIGVGPVEISQINDSGVLHFTAEDQEKYAGKGIANIAKSAPKELNLSKLTAEHYANPLKLLLMIIEDLNLAWDKEGIHLSEAQQKEIQLRFLNIIIQHATSAKHRLEE